ncbi:hypothetical protein G7L32_26780, partial [Klebsiella quasipneumoniae]|nr:hypothetical protein [Klebsiella quasipneumoniae]
AMHGAVGLNARYLIGIWTGRPDGTPVVGQFGFDASLPQVAAAGLEGPAPATGIAMHGAVGLNARYLIGIWTGRPDGTPVVGQFGF